MYVLHCNGTANKYFQKLERLAKLTGQRSEEEERGAMVRALQRGIPSSYINMIANIRTNVSTMYPEWKAHICEMYEQRQRQYILQ